MKIQTVSTCHREGWDKYGAQMVDSFVREWPTDVPMNFYPENFSISEYDGRICTREFPLWLDDFKAKWGDAPQARGLNSGGSYNFRFDAVRFAHKTAAVIDSYSTCKADALIWIDADIFFHSPVTHEFLSGLFPDEAQVAWLDRKTLYPECGFYFLRCKDPAVHAIMHRWKHLHETGDIFNLREWHDSFVFEHLVRSSPVRTASLSGKAYNNSHPAINGPLGAVLDHRKGPRKFAGRTPARERTEVNDNHPYWKKS